MRGRRGIRLRRIKVVQRPGGKRDLYYRHPSGRFISLPDLSESDPAFVAAYHKAQLAQPMPARAAEGSLAHAAIAYKTSAAWKVLAPQTRANRARIIDHIIRKGGTVPLTEVRPRHIASDIAPLLPHAARNRLKVWRALMKFAKSRGLVETDPAKAVDPPAAPTKGFHTWTDGEIARYRAFWAPGTRERMAMELALWSAARRSDAVRLGRQHLRDGELSYTQGKTGADVTIPVLPAFAAELASLPAGQMLFIETLRGSPHSAKAFGAWFRAACRKASLPGRCTLHGLRKARARIMAENGCTPSQIGAWTGHRTLAEIAHYSAKADRAKLARDAAKLERESIPFQKSRKA